MTDTTPEIRQKQLEIWLQKPEMERLRRTLEDNDALFSFWDHLKKSNAESGNDEPLRVVK